MIDREKVLAVLAKRFPHAAREETAAAANAIVGLEEEWEEVSADDFGHLAQHSEPGEGFRLFRRRQVFHQSAHIRGGKWT
jgi:hypothetical protein